MSSFKQTLLESLKALQRQFCFTKDARSTSGRRRKRRDDKLFSYVLETAAFTVFLGLVSSVLVFGYCFTTKNMLMDADTGEDFHLENRVWLKFYKEVPTDWSEPNLKAVFRPIWRVLLVSTYVPCTFMALSSLYYDPSKEGSGKGKRKSQSLWEKSPQTFA